MKKLLTLLLLISPAFTQIPEGYIVDAYTDTDGSYTETLVRVPAGYTAEEYAANAIPVAQYTPEDLPKGILSLIPFGNSVGLVYTITFGEFRELLPEPTWTKPVVAQNGETAVPEKQPGILSRSLQVAKENPWKTGIATFLVADYAAGNGIDAFGLFSDGDEAGRPTVNVSGENNTVTITDNANSGNDQSNRPATAAPFFPPAPTE